MLRGKRYRGWVFVYPMITAAAVVATANHYVLDVVAGLALALATCTVFGMLGQARRAPEAAPVLEPAPIQVIEPAPVPVLESLPIESTVLEPSPLRTSPLEP